MLSFLLLYLILCYQLIYIGFLRRKIQELERSIKMLRGDIAEIQGMTAAQLQSLQSMLTESGKQVDKVSITCLYILNRYRFWKTNWQLEQTQKLPLPYQNIVWYACHRHQQSRCIPAITRACVLLVFQHTQSPVQHVLYVQDRLFPTLALVVILEKRNGKLSFLDLHLQISPSDYNLQATQFTEQELRKFGIWKQHRAALKAIQPHGAE